METGTTYNAATVSTTPGFIATTAHGPGIVEILTPYTYWAFMLCVIVMIVFAWKAKSLAELNRRKSILRLLLVFVGTFSMVHFTRALIYATFFSESMNAPMAVVGFTSLVMRSAMGYFSFAVIIIGTGCFGLELLKLSRFANNTPDGIRQPADGSPKPSS